MATRSDIQLDLPAGACDAVLARPEGDGDHPPVLLVMDVFGLRPRLAQMAERIADAGYVVLAPNVFHRVARPPVFDEALLQPGAEQARGSRMGELFASLGPAEWAVDGPAYLDAVQSLAGSDEPVRVVGYCLGGRFGIHLAADHPDRVACVAAAHAGKLVTDDPASPHRRLAEVRCPVYLGHADEDGSMTPDDQAALAHAAGEAHLDYTGALYAGARHGYTMADRPEYDRAADERFHAASLALFARV